jgi:pteridine reductase
MNIKGKTAIITGATGGLASQIVLALAGAGANCICIYHKNSAKAKELGRKLKAISKNVIARSPDEIGTTKQSFPMKSGLQKRDCFAAARNDEKTKSIFIQADLTKPEDIEKIFDEIGGKTTPQILINAAAVFGKKSIGDINSEYIRQTFDINFAAAMLMTQKFVELVRQKIKSKQNPIGKIINFADITAQKPPAGFSVYCASKAALIAATKSLARELAPDLTVNAVAPGIMTWSKDTPPELKKKILAHIPAGRTGNPDEVAQAVQFLIENDYITGQVINIDGGRSL